MTQTTWKRVAVTSALVIAWVTTAGISCGHTTRPTSGNQPTTIVTPAPATTTTTAPSPTTPPPTTPPPTTPPPATPPPAAGLSGVWKGTWANHTPDHSTGTFTLNWTQTGSKLTGTIQIGGTPCLTGGSITGALSGKAISFGAVQGAVTVSYDGQVSGKRMAGTYTTDCGNAAGEWQATKTG